jgi:hypothetical protein
MALTEEKVTIYHCDAEGCTREAVAHNDESPTSGIEGTVTLSALLGGGNAPWFAHAPVHIGKAVKKILDSASTSAVEENTEVSAE